ncbi:hypothetical protein LguiA_007597 [Lonicera macranthoides]
MALSAGTNCIMAFNYSDRGEGEHLVNWDKVLKIKKFGGLGIGNLINRNSALLGEWLWRYLQEQTALWHSIIRSRHGSVENGWDTKEESRCTHRSPLKAIARRYGTSRKHVRFKVGNCEKIQFG